MNKSLISGYLSSVNVKVSGISSDVVNGGGSPGCGARWHRNG